jgi:hypothetical protein
MIKSVDKNQKKIVENLRQMGMTVIDLHEVGHGCPDIVVGYRGVNFLFEIKGRNGRLTENQVSLFAAWRGQVAIIRSTSDAVSIIEKKIKEY